MKKLKVHDDKEEGKEDKEKTISIADDSLYRTMLQLEDWDEKEPRCFISVPKKHQGKNVKFTVIVSKNEKRVLDEKLSKAFFVPSETQPSLGFDAIKVTDNTFTEVFNELVSLYKKYLFFIDETQYKILALAAMSTYFREVFFTYPYFDFLAAEYNCGKTTAMQALTWSCYQGFCMTNPRPATMFRAIDCCNSTIGVDELDNVLTKKEVAGEFISIFNSAYKKGLPAYRVNMSAGGVIEEYDAFGLKSFTHVSTGPELDSFKSRSILYTMMRSPKKLPNLDDPQVFVGPRDLMYSLRLRRQETVVMNHTWVEDNLTLMNRDAERFISILTMARCVSDKVYDIAFKWATAYIEDYAEDEIDEIRRVLIEVLLKKSGNVKRADLMDEFHDLMVIRDLIPLKSDGTPQWKYGHTRFTDMLRSFGIRKSRFRPHNQTHISVNANRVKRWAIIYGLVDIGKSELEQWLEDEGQESISDVKSVIESKPEKKVMATKKKKKKKLSKVDKFLFDHSPTSEFSPSSDSMKILMKCVDKNYFSEISPGVWKMTKTGKRKWNKLREK